MALSFARRKPDTIEATVTADTERAERDAKARAEDLTRDITGPLSEGQRELIELALMQWYHRGAIDTLDRLKARIIQ